MCPYYKTEYKTCAFYEGHTQDQLQRDSRCLDSNNWRHCPNYTGRSLDEKVNKRVRSNPDL